MPWVSGDGRLGVKQLQLSNDRFSGEIQLKSRNEERLRGLDLMTSNNKMNWTGKWIPKVTQTPAASEKA